MISFLRYLLLFSLFFVFTGCAGLSGRLPMPESEGAAARQAFREMVGGQRLCKRSGDADLTVTFDSRFFSGTLNGYLQTMAPSFVKLVGISPFNQPLAALVSDGEHFSYAVFNEKLVYEGGVDSEAYRRHVPAGLAPGNIFYALIGKLPPGEVLILSTSRDERNRGVWLEFSQKEESLRSLVLFDPDRQIILRHLKLDEEGETVMEIVYDDYGEGDCRLPGLINIQLGRSGEIICRLSDWRTGFSSSTADFQLDLPADFKRVKVN